MSRGTTPRTDPERSKDLTDGLTLRTGEWSVRVAFTPSTPTP
ncbi:hypothetical protein ABZ905_21160 [Streptomyces parvus]